MILINLDTPIKDLPEEIMTLSLRELIEGCEIANMKEIKIYSREDFEDEDTDNRI